MEYIIGSTSDPLKFTVSKFDGGEAPLETYTVSIGADGKQDNCDCMAWFSKKTRPCKHGKMLHAWMEAGEPEPGDYSIEGFGKDWVFKLTPKKEKFADEPSDDRPEDDDLPDPDYDRDL